MFLGIDLGTTNVKALLVDRLGATIATASYPVRLLQPGPGVAEQDLEEIWQACLNAIRDVVNHVGRSRCADVRALGVSSQGGAMQLLDRNRKPVGRVISWLDQRGQSEAEALHARLGSQWFLARNAHARAWLAVGQLLRLRASSPENLAPPNAVGFVGDLMVERLCGRAAHDGTSAALTLLYDPRRRRYDPDLLDLLGLLASQLPEVHPAAVPAGGLLPDVARNVGLPSGIPVSPAIHDQYAAALSTGTVRPGKVMVGTGTAWVLLATAKTLPEPVSDSSLISHHVVDDLFGQIVSLVNGGSTFQWALQLLGLSAADGAEIDRLILSAPPGSNGVTVWPFLAGAPGLTPEMRGRISGLNLSHGREHILRATLEGLAFELRRHLSLLQQHGCRTEELVLVGGAGRGVASPQLIADVTELRVQCAGEGAGSAHGAAILARALVQPEADLEDLAEEMMTDARDVKPSEAASFYARAYESYLRSLPRGN
jgi:xylulokinase